MLLHGARRPQMVEDSSQATGFGPGCPAGDRSQPASRLLPTLDGQPFQLLSSSTASNKTMHTPGRRFASHPTASHSPPSVSLPKDAVRTHDKPERYLVACVIQAIEREARRRESLLPIRWLHPTHLSMEGYGCHRGLQCSPASAGARRTSHRQHVGASHRVATISHRQPDSWMSCTNASVVSKLALASNNHNDWIATFYPYIFAEAVNSAQDDLSSGSVDSSQPIDRGFH
jgi:hypothetical protein